MRVLVVNAGSSSLKLAVVDGQDRAEEQRLERWDGSGEQDAVRDLLDRAGPVDAVGHRVVHGGPGHDGPALVDDALLDQLEERSRRLVAVYGNNDHGALRERLPEVARAEIEGLRFAVVHETGDAKGRELRCAARFPDTDVLVFGHSHIPWDTTAPSGLRLINPGSPTDRRRQPHGTFVTAVADAGQLRDVVLHAVPPRT